MTLAVVAPADLPLVRAQMCGSYRMRVRAHLTDLNHGFLADITSSRTDGAVTVDTSQPVTRSLRFDTFDPGDVLGLESSRNGYTAPTVMVRVWRDIYVLALLRWVEIPVFWGPITKPSRSGLMLSIEAQDKAALASFETSSLTIPKGTNGASAIRRALQHVGETRFRLPTTTKVLKRDYVIGVDATPLTIARQIASSMGWRLFWDAEGYCVATVAPSGSSFTFRTGIGGSITSPVSTGYWDADIVNRVIVEGATVNGKKLTAVATLNRNHELSPENLMRDGKVNSGWRPFRAAQMNSLTTLAETGKWADDELYRRSIQSRSISFDSRPIWDLQEHDVFTVQDDIDAVYATGRVQQMTIPLTCEGVQSNGYLSRPGKRTKARVTRRAYKKKK